MARRRKPDPLEAEDKNCREPWIQLREQDRLLANQPAAVIAKQRRRCRAWLDGEFSGSQVLWRITETTFCSRLAQHDHIGRHASTHLAMAVLLRRFRGVCPYDCDERFAVHRHGIRALPEFGTSRVF